MRIGPQRPVNPDAIVAPQGYRVEALITGLSFPSAISFGPGGELYLAESGGVAGTTVATPRVLRIDPDRSVNEIGRLENPIVGLVYRNGELLIGEDGPSARILRVTAEGELQILVDSLPGGGDYGLSGLSLDSSGALLFGIGTRTNSGVVGLDNVARGWVARNPDWADVVGTDVTLAGVNYVTSEPGLRGTARVTTGGFKPFGARSERGESLRGSARCGGAIYRLGAEVTERGSAEPERLAWGLRNPIGVACSPDGRIFATEGGMEERGSRPIAAAPDNLWEIRPGSYYGWPDFASGVPVTDARFRLPGHPQPRRLLEDGPATVGTPAATFAARTGVGRLDFSTSEAFGFVGDVLVALSGGWSNAAYASEDAMLGGHRVVRVDPRTGATVDFLANRQGAPSSAGNSGGLERPFDVRFDPSGEVLYVVDMGEAQLSREFGLEPFGGTGVVWRITRIRSMVQVPARGGRGGRAENAGRTEDTAGAAEREDFTDDVAAVDEADSGEETTLLAWDTDGDEATELNGDELALPEADDSTDSSDDDTEPEAEAAGDFDGAADAEPVNEGTLAVELDEAASEAAEVADDDASAPDTDTEEPEATDEPAPADEVAELAASEDEPADPGQEPQTDEEPRVEDGMSVAPPPAEEPAAEEPASDEPASEPEVAPEGESEVASEDTAEGASEGSDEVADLPPAPEGAAESLADAEPASEDGEAQ
ncbi:MAG: glucose dehydrogenase [Armatimonadetes bacterium]|nr:glucose dehydrogenase [Armatimonadota bacterium]